MMTLIASLSGALICGAITGLFVDDNVEGELAQLCGGFAGVIIGIVLFNQFNLI